MRFVRLVGYSLFVTFFSASASAQVACGGPYSIAPGDTLTLISLNALGDARRWPEVYQYGQNVSRIGQNPNSLNVGVVIDLPPCEERNVAATQSPSTASSSASTAPGQSAEPSRRLSVPTALTTQAPSTAPAFEVTVEVLTGGDLQPLIDRDAPNRGMLTEMIEAAFAASGVENPRRIDFVNDRASHITILLKHNRYEFRYPWTKPNCREVDQLPPEDRVRCEYVYSDPLYVIANDVFGLKSDRDPPERFEDLENKRLCRPDGRSVDDLREVGLVHARNVLIERPSSLADCFRMLEFGEVDYVTDGRFAGERAIKDADLDDYIESYPDLATAVELHLIAHRDNARAAILWMRAFNSGLRTIQASGQWDAIINDGVAEFRRSLQ